MREKDKSNEATLRYRAKKLGLLLKKARTRSQASPIHGTFGLVDGKANVVILGDSNGFGFTLDDVEDWLHRFEQPKGREVTLG